MKITAGALQYRATAGGFGTQTQKSDPHQDIHVQCYADGMQKPKRCEMADTHGRECRRTIEEMTRKWEEGASREGGQEETEEHALHVTRCWLRTFTSLAAGCGLDGFYIPLV